jgi:hypothetical protein
VTSRTFCIVILTRPLDDAAIAIAIQKRRAKTRRPQAADLLSARGHLLVALRLVRDLLLFAKHLFSRPNCRMNSSKVGGECRI